LIDLTNLLLELEARLKTASFITDTNNVVFGESWDQFQSDGYFPRLETMILELADTGYHSNQSKVWDCRFVTAGWMKTAKKNYPLYTASELGSLCSNATELESIIKGFNSNPPSTCDNFLQVGEFTKLETIPELQPGLLAFGYLYSFHLYD
jgi:hypothetical protein